jgi:hypothetical protein
VSGTKSEVRKIKCVIEFQCAYLMKAKKNCKILGTLTKKTSNLTGKTGEKRTK